jgi:hypothetical protein
MTDESTKKNQPISPFGVGIVLTAAYFLLLAAYGYINKDPFTDVRHMKSAGELGELMLGVCAPVITLWLIIGTYLKSR